MNSTNPMIIKTCDEPSTDHRKNGALKSRTEAGAFNETNYPLVFAWHNSGPTPGGREVADPTPAGGAFGRLRPLFQCLVLRRPPDGRYHTPLDRDQASLDQHY